MANNEEPTQDIIHFWQVIHDDMGKICSLSMNYKIEATIRALQKLEQYEEKR